MSSSNIIVPSSRAPVAVPRVGKLPQSQRQVVSPGQSTGYYSNASNSANPSKSIYEKNLNRRTSDISLASFSFLFSESVQYLQKKSSGIQDLEAKLNQLGYRIGQRTLELLTLREGKSAKRETKILGVLQFINTSVWRTLFGKTADGLEKSRDSEYECK